MFYRFSAKPTKGSGRPRRSASHSRDDDDGQSKRIRKAPRACDRCRLHHIKCEARKPCAQCVAHNLECIVSECHDRDDVVVTTRLPQSASESNHGPAEGSLEVRGNTSGVQDALDNLSPVSCVFVQLPHPPLPSPIMAFTPDTLPQSQQTFFLRIFRESCHSLLLMTDTEFVEMERMPPTDPFGSYSSTNALLDCMIALGIQHAHSTGLIWRVLAVRVGQSPHQMWPGFEYFSRSRDYMRTSMGASLADLRCHVLMIVYLLKRNAYSDAYNLLGITVRKAYVAKLHRPPPSHLPENVRTTLVQLWWVLFSLDIQCSFQLGMPAASDGSVITCPFPAQNELSRYASSPEDGERFKPYMFSMHTTKLFVLVAEMLSHVSITELVEDNTHTLTPETVEENARNIQRSLDTIKGWRAKVPSELLLIANSDHVDNAMELDSVSHLSLPIWLQRHKILLELHYHNTFVLSLRPFVNYRLGASGDDSMRARQPQVSLNIDGALHHATVIINTVFTICSWSDAMYGWSEILQSLWNATLTILSWIRMGTLDTETSSKIETLKRAEIIFDFFALNSPSNVAVRDRIRALVQSLQDCHLPPATENLTDGTIIDISSDSVFSDEQHANLADRSSANDVRIF